MECKGLVTAQLNVNFYWIESECESDVTPDRFTENAIECLH